MAKYEMNDDKWNRNVSKVEAHLAQNEVAFSASIESMIELGNNDADNRMKYWEGIRALYATISNSPIGPGARTSLPDDVDANILSLKDAFCEASQTSFMVPAYGSLQMPRGGYRLYEDAEDYAESDWSAAKNRLTIYYKNHTKNDESKPRWDGTLNDDGLPVIIPATKEDEE